MSRTFSWRRLAAAPLVAFLALGGALVATAPAYAALGTLAVTAPAEGSTPESRSFDITGTGTEGAGVGAETADGTILGAVVVEAGGGWTLPVVFAPDAPVDQEITIVQVDPDNPLDPEPDTAVLNVVLPTIVVDPEVPAGEIVITSPTDGATLEGRYLGLEGTAPAGSTVDVFWDGSFFYGALVGPDEFWGFGIVFPPGVPNTATFVVSGVDSDGAELISDEITVTAGPELAAPVLVSPIDGEVVVGENVTFTGTGVPGNLIGAVLVGTDEASQAALDAAPLTGFYGSAIIVGDDGTWEFPVVLPEGSFTVAVAHFVYSSIDAVAVSQFSEPRAFSVAAEVVAAPVATTPGTPLLANTGAVVDGGAETAAALALAGLLLLLVRSRLAARSARVSPLS